MYKTLALAGLTVLATAFSGTAALAIDLNGASTSLTIGGITARTSKGINPEGTNGTLGAFSEFYGKNTTTIDFNAPGTHLGGNSYTYGNDMVTYTFDNGMNSQAYSGKTGVYSDHWAPSGANGEKNDSKYLAVFQNSTVTIDLAEELNYFGIDWGAMSPNNNFAFLKDGVEVSNFNYTDVNPLAQVTAAQHNNESNGYVHFYAEAETGTFDQIVISQTGGGGFESDNHSFRFGNTGFDFDNPDEPTQDVPEPTAMVGLLAVGALLLRRRATVVS